MAALCAVSHIDRVAKPLLKVLVVLLLEPGRTNGKENQVACCRVPYPLSRTVGYDDNIIGLYISGLKTFNLDTAAATQDDIAFDGFGDSMQGRSYTWLYTRACDGESCVR